jgi:hypothetical protein
VTDNAGKSVLRGNPITHIELSWHDSGAGEGLGVWFATTWTEDGGVDELTGEHCSLAEAIPHLKAELDRIYRWWLVDGR